MKELKSSSSRLVRLFKQSRENWKETALERQQKLRALEIKIRDLSLSRENWKKRVMKAEKELRIFRTNSIDVKKRRRSFRKNRRTNSYRASLQHSNNKKSSTTNS